MRTSSTTESGYIALITGILISVSLLILVSVVSFQGFFSRFTVFESEQKEVSDYLAEACVQTAILEIAQDLSYTGNQTVPVVDDHTCQIISVSPGTFPSLRRIRVQSQVGDAYTNLEVEINTASLPTIDIESWKEVSHFGP